MLSKSNNYYRVILPNDNDVTFDSLIDLADQKSELNGLINYINSNGSVNIPLYSKFFLIGPEGCGKKSLAIAFAHEIESPIVIVSIDTLIAHTEDTIQRILALIYKKCNKLYKKYYNCVIYFDKLQYMSINSYEDKSFPLISLIANEIKRNSNIITFGSTNPLFKYPAFIFSEDYLEKKIGFDYPELKVREELFKHFASIYSTDDNIDFNSLAKDVYEVTGGDIKKIMQNTYNHNLNKNKSIITQSDIEQIITTMYYGNEKKKPTEKERKATAYHEAGHAIAGYYSNIKDLNKIDIIHRENSLGMNILRIDEDKYSQTCKELENYIIFCLGGYASELLTLKTTTTGVRMDLYQATSTCALMIQSYGMNTEMGPVCILYDESVLLMKLDEDSNYIIKDKMKEYLEKTKKILEEHFDELMALSEALLEKEVIMIDEMVKIIEKVKNKNHFDTLS